MLPRHAAKKNSPRRLTSRTAPRRTRPTELTSAKDQQPGISRVPARKGFRYYTSRGRLVRDPAVLRRIQSLVIPPAWKDVWICPDPKGHLQATGRDARNRKQYRYHPLYRAAREETKYGKLIAFGRTLHRIRRKVRRDLALPGLPEEKVLATVVRVMDLAQIRVGNEEYARANQSYGLTTMRDRHVEINGSTLHFEFKGKSGKIHVLDLQDRRLGDCKAQSRPAGVRTVSVPDERGAHVPLESGMVNRYLRETTGEDITRKTFARHGTGRPHGVGRVRCCVHSDRSQAECCCRHQSCGRQVGKPACHMP